jgi:hypothetical protein
MGKESVEGGEVGWIVEGGWMIGGSELIVKLLCFALIAGIIVSF